VLSQKYLFLSNIIKNRSSGYMSEDQRDKVRALGVKYFLDKPFTDKKMLDSLETVLFE